MSLDTTMTFTVSGMNCRSCVRRISEVLAERFDRLQHEVDLERRTLTISFPAETASEAAIADAMSEAGYPITRLTKA